MRTLVAVAYFFMLGYCVRAFDWDKDLLRLAGNVVDQVAIRWTEAADETRRRSLEAGHGA